MTVDEILERDNRAVLSAGKVRLLEARVGGLPVSVSVQCLITGEVSGIPLMMAVVNEGAAMETRVLHCCTVDLPFRPVFSQILSIDGVQHLVLSCSDVEGMLEVKLQEDRV